MRHFSRVIAAFIIACAPEREPGELIGATAEDEVIVDGVLIVGQKLPDLFVRRTLSLNQRHTREAAGILDAEVRVLQGSQEFAYAADADWAGRYLPPLDAPLVEPQTEYALEVLVGAKQVRAHTTTPERIQVRETVLIDEKTSAILRTLKSFAEVGDAVYEAPENQLTHSEGFLEIRLAPSPLEIYQVALFSQDRDSEFVINDDFIDSEEEKEEFRNGSSPPLAVRDGIVRLPWFAVVFAGRYLTKVYALDQNWFDYTRSNPQEGGGNFAGGLIGDNFERPLFHVEGGIGLFGSASVDSVGFFVLPRP